MHDYNGQPPDKWLSIKILFRRVFEELGDGTTYLLQATLVTNKVSVFFNDEGFIVMGKELGVSIEDNIVDFDILLVNTLLQPSLFIKALKDNNLDAASDMLKTFSNEFKKYYEGKNCKFKAFEKGIKPLLTHKYI